MAKLSMAWLFTDRISELDNAIASIRPSVRLYPLSLLNRLTYDLDLLHMSTS